MMTKLHALFLAALTTFLSSSTHAFTIPHHVQRTHQLNRYHTSTSPTTLHSEPDEEAIECYIVETPPPLEDDEDGEGDTMVATEKPVVVCTPDPEEYAWFNGIDTRQMKPVEDDMETDATECVEGSSPRGTPEWECK
mmetsp:Transcript_2542/g.3436  ORF Transcript_2542/g.3436 Transcript_2542/m.3436 type:complete len:137 (-) Transcript_2542:455-865(-)